MLEGAVVFLAFAALGIYQAAPSVTTGDAGEFAAAAAVWGVPHAPGYPTWTVLAKVFGTAFQVGNWSYRANLLSVVCAALALALLGDALKRGGVSRAARLGAVVILGLTPLWREQSAVAEVFAPLVLSGAGLLWLVAAAGERLLEPGPAAALGLVFGLGLGAHQTVVLVLPALLLAGRDKPGRFLPALGWAALGTALGFGLHLTIPLRALKSPPVDWGHATTLDSFLRLLLRRDYGTFALTVEGANAFGPAELAVQVGRFGRAMTHAFGPAGLILAAVGTLRAKRGVPAAWLLVTGPLFLCLGRPGFDAQTAFALERFYLLPMLGATVFIAAGLAMIEARSFATALAVAGLAAFSLLPGARDASRRDDYLAYDYGRAILRALPPHSVFVMDGGDDTFYSLSYLTLGAGLRRDVELRDRGGVVFPGGYGPDFRRLTREAKEARRREVEGRWFASGRLWYSTLNDGILPGAELVPAGLLRRPNASPAQTAVLRETLAVRRSRAGEAARYRDRALGAFVPYQRGLDALARGEEATSWLLLAADAAPDALWVAPSVSYSLGVEGFRAMGRKDWPSAQRAYRAGAELEPRKAEPMTNLGVALERAGRLSEAEAAFREAARREPGAPGPWSALGARLWADKSWADSADAFTKAAALGDARAAGFAVEARRRATAK